MKRLFYTKIMYPVMAVAIIVFAVSCKNALNDLATVVTDEISNKTVNAALCGGEVTDQGGSPVTARGVCWSEYKNPTIADHRTSDGEGVGVFASYLDGLTVDVIYYVRAYATNAAGIAYGSEISFVAGSSGIGAGFFTDERDQHVYRTRIIGHQTWMAENLAYLPAVSPSDTGSLTSPHFYIYGYDSTIVSEAKEHILVEGVPKDTTFFYREYGVLYNWAAARVSCPAGWHLPSEAEWNTLVETIGNPSGGPLKETGRKINVADTARWITPNMGGTNTSGFTARPGGERYSMGDFRYLGKSAVFWSSTILNDSNTWAWHLYHDKDIIDRDWFSNGNGFSVRCLKN